MPEQRLSREESPNSTDTSTIVFGVHLSLSIPQNDSQQRKIYEVSVR
jgi:hypothetical protein